MEQKELINFTTEELLKEKKDIESFSIINAFLIGFLIGIVFVSIYFKAYTLVLLLPLFLIYKLVNDPKNKRAKEINEILKQRNQKA